MTALGTAPQSTSKAVSSANSSSRIIVRVPPMAAWRASLALMAGTPTQQHYPRSKEQCAAGGNPMMNENVEATK